MSVISALTLFINALFNIVTWPRFLQRIAKDERARDANGRRTTFYRVHLILVTCAVVIAAASVVVGVCLLVI